MKFFLFFLFFFQLSLSQNKLDGTITDKRTGKSISGCTIYNVSKNKGSFSNEKGNFSIYADIGDLIQITHLGYHISEFYINTNTERIDIALEPFVKILKPAIITEENLAKQSILYNPDYERNKKTPKRPIFDYQSYKNNGLNAFRSPISYIFYTTNKREQRRLEYLKKIEDREIANKIYDYYFISQVTKEYDEDEVNKIKIHCYFSEDEILNSSQYSLAIKLKSCYLDYLLWKNDREKFLRIQKLRAEQAKADRMIQRSKEFKLDSFGQEKFEKNISR